MLAPDNDVGVLVPMLLALSQLGRMSKDLVPQLLSAGLVPLLRPLLEHTDAAVRARVCNVVGNLCRHNDACYEALRAAEMVPALVERCADPDRSTRKFACFAIGNAGMM